MFLPQQFAVVVGRQVKLAAGCHLATVPCQQTVAPKNLLTIETHFRPQRKQFYKILHVSSDFHKDLTQCLKVKDLAPDLPETSSRKLFIDPKTSSDSISLHWPCYERFHLILITASLSNLLHEPHNKIVLGSSQERKLQVCNFAFYWGFGEIRVGIASTFPPLAFYGRLVIALRQEGPPHPQWWQATSCHRAATCYFVQI